MQAHGHLAERGQGSCGGWAERCRARPQAWAKVAPRCAVEAQRNRETRARAESCLWRPRLPQGAPAASQNVLHSLELNKGTRSGGG